MVKTAVLVSGGGTNLQALIDAKVPGCELSVVISSNERAFALERAENAGIPTLVINEKAYMDRKGFCAAIKNALLALEIELVVLAGFMFVLDGQIISAFENRIINIHPALIPAFSGEGFYGLRVHEAALERGVKLTGATAHFVNAECDAGPIILQRAVEVLEGDTAQTLQKRVMEQAEWRILPEAVGLFCQGRLVVEGKLVRIIE